jgi:hypothetical protein
MSSEPSQGRGEADLEFSGCAKSEHPRAAVGSPQECLTSPRRSALNPISGFFPEEDTPRQLQRKVARPVQISNTETPVKRTSIACTSLAAAP